MLWAFFLACDGEPASEVVVARGDAPDVGSPSTLRRLTVAQYRNAIADLFGEDIVVPSGLEPDVEVDGLRSLGSAVTTISPLGVEQYEAAAFQVAEQVLVDGHERLVCAAEGVRDDVCARQVLEPLGQDVLRRPLGPDELDRYVDIAGTAAEAVDSFEEGLQFAMAGMLQSPHFLYRVERAETGALDDFEMASRLSFFLWDSVPDSELLEAATAGELTHEGGLSVQVDRMLGDPRARRGVRALFVDLYRLHLLDGITKDPTVFNRWSLELRDSALEETLSTLEAHVFDQDRPYGSLFTSPTTFVDRRLAALYGVPAPVDEGFGAVALGPDVGRSGLLGHASILMMEAHPVSSSVTKRGVFVRTQVLCQVIPPPPADVDTSIPEPSDDAPTMRERVAVHLQEPACATCHRLTDPIGLGLENFDGVGEFRERENGVPINPSGELEGQPFLDAVGLGRVIANHPNLDACLVQRMFSVAHGVAPERGDPMVDWHLQGFEQGGGRVSHLLRDLVMSPAFRTVEGAP